MKIQRIFLLMVLLLMTTVLAACDDGGDDDGGDNGGDSGSLNFNQNYDANGVSFTYPEGWVLVDQDGQLAIANNQEAADALAAGGTPPDNATAVLFIPFPTQGMLDAAGVMDLFAGEAAPDDTLQIGSDREETTIGEFTTITAPINVEASDDGPGGEGTLYVVEYSENTIFVAVGVATGDNIGDIAPVVENMVSTLEVDEAALAESFGF